MKALAERGDWRPGGSWEPVSSRRETIAALRRLEVRGYCESYRLPPDGALAFRITEKGREAVRSVKL